ncbi:MAG: hypothetical protein AAF587_12220 [Bacteroidota bacterium]
MINSKSFFTFFVLITFFLCLQAQKKVNYTKKAYISLTTGQAKTLKKNPMFKVNGLKAYPANGFLIFAHKNRHFLTSISDLKKGFKKIPSNITTHFQDVGSGTTENGTILIWVCSCGDNKYDSEGDMCYMRMRDSGIPECTGGCYEGNEGSSCSVTMDVIYPSGTSTTLHE